VTNVFTITGRGIVLCPELLPIGDERFRTNDALRLKRPDGTEEIVRISDLGVAKTLSGRSEVLVRLEDKTREDVPVGTEVWSL